MQRASLFTLTTVISFFLVNLAQAENNALYYILDGSGSMWGRVEGNMKIQIAKDTLGGLLREMPANLDSGLTVYGHRRKGDCTDIEHVIPLGSVDKDLTARKVKAITPRGKTPIADSISQALGLFKGREGAATVVLVSDGIETCGQDPCALTGSLKASGVNFVMHVVGFDVGDTAQTQLQCIADAGGGRYFSANNATDLLEALTTVKDNVVAQKALPEPAAIPEPTLEPEQITQNVTASTKSVRIKAKGPGTIVFKHDSWLKAPSYWKLLNPETGEQILKSDGLDDQRVAAGVYQLGWRQIEHGAKEIVLGEVFAVESGKKTEVPLRTGLRLVLPTWVERPYYWRLQDPVSGDIVTSFSVLDPQLVPPGSYEFRWREVEHGAREVSFGEIEIEPDKLNELTLSTAVNMIAADWGPKKFYYWKFVDKKDPKRIFSFSGKYRPQLVPPGEYYIISRPVEHGTMEAYLGEIVVKEGQMNEYAVNTGLKFIMPAGQDPYYYAYFVPLDGKSPAKKTGLSGKLFDTGFPLAPGKYRVELQQSSSGSNPIVIVEEMELPAGVLAEIEL